MDIRVLAIGRAGRSHEAELVQDYIKRAENAGRRFGLQKVHIQELDERKIDGRDQGARALKNALEGEPFWLLDERGKNLSSPEFAKQIGDIRDQGWSRLNFVIGGADGISDEFRQDASTLLSFGKMVWPHMLARVMLAEQIYRATSIWAGTPYHRF